MKLGDIAGWIFVAIVGIIFAVVIIGGGLMGLMVMSCDSPQSKLPWCQVAK